MAAIPAARLSTFTASTGYGVVRSTATTGRPSEAIAPRSTSSDAGDRMTPAICSELAICRYRSSFAGSSSVLHSTTEKSERWARSSTPRASAV